MEKEKCEHKWKEDEMFASGAVMMVSNAGGEHSLDMGHETRVVCEKCGAADYVPKNALDRFNLGDHL